MSLWQLLHTHAHDLGIPSFKHFKTTYATSY